MKSSENFLKQYEAYVASQWHARRMEFKFMEAVPAMFKAIRTEMDVGPARFGTLLGVSVVIVRGIEDGTVAPGSDLLSTLRQILGGD